LALAEVVPFHSTQAAGLKFPSKVVWTLFEIALGGPNIFKRGLGSDVSEKGLLLAWLFALGRVLT
jgi:hypothetical protein